MSPFTLSINKPINISNKVLLPEPVLPIKAIFSPFFILKLISSRINLDCSSYLKLKLFI